MTPFPFFSTASLSLIAIIIERSCTSVPTGGAGRSTALHCIRGWNPSLSACCSPWGEIKAAGNRDGIELHHIQIATVCLSHLCSSLGPDDNDKSDECHDPPTHTHTSGTNCVVARKHHLALKGKELSIWGVRVKSESQGGGKRREGAAFANEDG